MKTHLSFSLCLSLTVPLFALLLPGCSDSDSSTPAQVQAFQGTWEREGYGDIVQINDQGGALYQYTRSTCLKADTLDDEDVAELFDDATLSDDGMTLTLGDATAGAFPIHFTQRTSLPGQCEDARLITEATPTRTFEHFAQTYADYYAFFTERGVDWSAQIADARSQVSDAMSQQALFEVLSSMLAPINDGHVQLTGLGTVYRPVKPVGANPIVMAAFDAQSDDTDLQTFANAISLQYWENVVSYLDADSVRVFDGALPQRVIWATLNDGTVGYLYIASMAYLSDDDEGLSQTANRAAMEAIMQTVMNDLQHTQAMIIDVRNNIGGHDTVSKVVASHFTDQQRVFGTKLARSYQGDTAPVTTRLDPVASPYLSPVAIIAGIETASAAESFTLAMRALPQVTLVGERTNGILSDVLEKQLPNGWEMWLANEVYFDHLGVNHEASGIPMDIEAPVFSLAAIAEGHNPAIDTALSALGY